MADIEDGPGNGRSSDGRGRDELGQPGPASWRPRSRPAPPAERRTGPQPRPRAAARRRAALARRRDLAERAAGADPARGARPDHDAQGGGRPAGPAAGRLRHLPRAATTTTRSTSSPAAASCGSTSAPSVDLDDLLPRPGGHAQRGAQRRRRARLRAGRRGRDAQGAARRRRARPGHRPRRRGARRPPRRAAARRHASASATRCCSTRGPATSTRRCPKSEVEELVLEEVPDIDYTPDRRPGSARSSRSATPSSCPTCTPTCSTSTSCEPPKGVLLYGPPGCGKTLIAKAVANSLAKKVAARHRRRRASRYFLNIKGPELLNKYVGETERHIRLVFQRAREKASEGTPGHRVLRRDGLAVPHPRLRRLLRRREHHRPAAAERDRRRRGAWRTCIVIGASNREDMIDPAILRPGRLDVKIKIERPDAEAARDIFSKYLTADLPLHADDLAEYGGDRDACVGGDDPGARSSGCTPRPRRTASSR